MSCLNADGWKTRAVTRTRKLLSEGVTLQHKLYQKLKVGCKWLTGIQQTVLWYGDYSSDEQVKVCDMELYNKHAVLLPFEDVYIMIYNIEGVVEIPPNIEQFCSCHTPCRQSR